MPFLEDARAALEIDRERMRLLREAEDVTRRTLDTARELAQLGDQERPKNERFAQSMRDASTISPVAPFTPGGAGPGAGLPVPAASSSGGGGAGGGAAAGGGRSLTGRTIISRGGVVRSEDWVAAHCTRVQVEIPRPGSLRADDLVTIDAWDCSASFEAMGLPYTGDAALFYDRASVEQYLTPRISFTSTGGAGRGGTSSGGARTQNDPRVPVNRQGAADPRVPVPTTGSVTGSSVASEDGRLVARTLKEEFGLLRRDLRAGGDLGLQIRRNGGL